MLEQCHLPRTTFRWLFNTLFIGVEILQPLFDNIFQCSVKHFMMLFSWFPTMEYILGYRLAHHPSPGTALCTQAVLSQRAAPSPCLLSLSFLRACIPLLEHSSHSTMSLWSQKDHGLWDGRQISSSSWLFPMLHACVQAPPRGTLVSCCVFPSQCPVGTPCFHAIACKQLRWLCLTLSCRFCGPLHTRYLGPLLVNVSIMSSQDCW